MEGITEDGIYRDVVFATTIATLPSSPSSSPIYSSNFSLAEHSYCATLSTANPPPEEVADIFEITVGGSGSSDNQLSAGGTLGLDGEGGGDLVPSREFSIEFEEDVNFDGFNFSIPLNVEEDGCGGKSMELGLGGLQWGNRSDVPWGGNPGGIRTVEVTSSSSIDKLTESDNNGGERIGGTFEEAASQHKEGHVNEMKMKKGKTKVSKYSRPRRRDYIENPREREKFFEDILKRLTLQLHHAMCRTGCEGEISAIFEGKVFNANPASNCRPAADGAVNDGDQHSNVNPSLPCTSMSDRSQVDDHRYAATIVTQNVLSSTVWDHQYAYDEKITAPVQEWDVDYDEERDINNAEVSQTKRVKKVDYIKSGCAREQTLCKLAKSLFWQKIRLELRTGAMITLILKYGSCIINDKNYQDCAKLIAASKRPGKVVAQLAPKPADHMPLSFILPGQHPIRIPVSLPLSETVSHSNSTSPFYEIVTEGANSVIFPIYPDDNATLQSNQNFSTDHQNVTIQEDSNATSYHSGDGEFELTSSDNNFINTSQGCPHQATVITSTVGASEVKDSSTNTEPICSICQNGDIISSCGAGSKAKNLFWIRCNDPFCYDVVHASCVGFMVTHAAHLRQLPPFYCKLHRKLSCDETGN